MAPPVLPRVLAYHKVTGFELGGTWMPPGRFIGHIDRLRRAGWNFIGETAFIESLEGVRPVGPREVLLTFDDGYRHLLEEAVPALEARGIGALIFLVSAFVGRENSWELALPGRRFAHLSWTECADLVRRGFAFGSHTRTHPDLTRLPPAAALEEIEGSRAEIEKRLGTPVHSFSYPFGRLDDALRAAVRGAGYRAAFTLYPRRGGAGPDRYELRRDPVYIIDSAGSVLRKLGRGVGAAVEEMKGRMINAAAVLTPLLKDAVSRASSSSRRAREGR